MLTQLYISFWLADVLRVTRYAREALRVPSRSFHREKSLTAILVHVKFGSRNVDTFCEYMCVLEYIYARTYGRVKGAILHAQFYEAFF